MKFENEEVVLNEGDFFILEPEITHEGRAEYCEMIAVCTPPFDEKNMEIL